MKEMIKTRLFVYTMVACIVSLILGVVDIHFAWNVAYAEVNYVAEVSSIKYEKFNDAWAAVEDEGTITMLGNWTIDRLLTVDEGKEITINMKGFMINRKLSGPEDSGQIFLVKPNATLNIFGEANSHVSHNGTVQNNLWHYKDNGNYPIKGALLTGAYNANGGGAIHIQNNATVNINNVTIAGNASSNRYGAGAIRLQGENAELNFIDSEICYNKATGGGGGAIRIEGEDSSVLLKNSRIHHNVTTDDDSDGGAIQINNGIVRAENSEISFNTTKRNGGGVYISNGNLVLDENCIFSHNNSNKEGGAIYVDYDADNVEIKGIFSGNYAKEEGGAIYVNSSINGNKGVKISNAEFLGNTSIGNGGGIYVDEDNNISLSNKVVVNGCSPNNLYIRKSNTIASSQLTEGSMVGITTSWTATSTNPIIATNYKYFVCDNQEYKTVGTTENVYFEKISTETPSTYNVNGIEYPLKKGQFVYNSAKGGQMTAYYYYSNGYFANSAKYYNEHLSTMSLNLAMAAVTADYEGDYTEEKASINVVELFDSLGFENLYIHFPEPKYFGEDAENLSTIGYVIASKTANINGVQTTIIATAVRGGRYGAEWASNVTLGSGIGEAKGFGDAARQVKNGIDDYLATYSIDTETSKFWISGFSRAAATSNLVAKKLTDEYGEDNVYAYCFEAPKGGVFGEMIPGLHYSNIHSIINKSDVVTAVGTTEMGFIRYGVDHILPAYNVGTSGYKTQKEQMLKQLAALNPNISFNDYFHEATVSYVGSYIEGWFFDDVEYIEENWSTDYDYAEDWIPFFIKKLQEYSLTNNTEDSVYNKDSSNWHGYRNFWSTYKWYLYEDASGNLLIKCYENEPGDASTVDYVVLTLEGSIANIMDFYFGASGDKKEQIMNAIDLNAIMDRLNLSEIYSDVIKKWNGYSVDDKNGQFNKVWNVVKIEEQLSGIITDNEMFELKTSFYVVLDFLLDFVADDYDETDQDIIGTLLYNISNILQTHYYDVVCAWTRSYDSFYSADIASPPLPPEATLKSGTYRNDLTIELFADNENMQIYYTLDGTIPNLNDGNAILYDKYIELTIEDGKCKNITLKAICVYNELVSEVATYNYILNTNAEISLEKDILRVYNFDGSAFLILAEYDSNNIMRDIYLCEVVNNSYILKSSISLNFDNKIMAYLVRDLDFYAPLCIPYCLTEDTNEKGYIKVDSQNVLNIISAEASQDSNPEYINVTFTIDETNATNLMVTLFEKSSKSNFEKILYFNQIEKNESNIYSFTIARAMLQEVLGGSHVNNSTLVIFVNGNGIPSFDKVEIVYEEEVYNITYELYDGVNHEENPSVYTMSTDTITLQNPTKAHYTFVGWYNNEKFAGPVVTSIEKGSSSNIKLFAKWQINQYTVTYTDGVDGSIFKSKVSPLVDYNSKTPPFGDDPIRDGYLFMGWDKEVAESVSADVVYTAVWVKNHIHSPSLVQGLEPTCCTTGYKEYYVCEGCGYFENEDCTISILDIELWKQTAGCLAKTAHIYTEQIRDISHLVAGTGINCQDAVRYYYDCINCDAIGIDQWVSDIYGAHKIDSNFKHSNGQHYHICLQEGCDYTTEKINCSGGTATCQSKALCEVCEQEYGELGDHRAQDSWTTNETEHWHECEYCDEQKLNDDVHIDEDCDNICDVCQYKLNTADSPSRDKTLSIGAIVAISVASTIAVSVGTFSFIWFVIKKKSWLDLVAIFKRK